VTDRLSNAKKFSRRKKDRWEGEQEARKGQRLTINLPVV
jgi:hypothetical protein